jgi:hypothetical protein
MDTTSEDLFYAFGADDRVASMETVLRMITHGTDHVRQDKEDRISRLEKTAIDTGMDDEPEWIYDMANDEFYLDDLSIRILYAGLAVIISSATENLFETICSHYHIKLKSRAMWGDKRTALEGKLLISLEDLPGFKLNKRARLMANCFKHSDGRANEELARYTGVRKGDEIKYEIEPWDRIIRETERMFRDICQIVAKTV